MTEPIEYFLSKEGFDRSKIAEYVIGEKYTAIMNTDGNIGVCATLGTQMDDELMKTGKPDTSNPSHRILLNAWFNSICNYRQSYDDIKDIFEYIDFRDRGRIVMVGYFETLYEKFRKEGIEIEVFDIQKQSSILSDISGFNEAISSCDTIILTGTTIFNNTFNSITGRLSPGCSVFLLGPSNVLSRDMFNYPGIDIVFGSVFKKGDTRVLDKIRQGKGTRGFIEYLDKVYICKNNI